MTTHQNGDHWHHLQLVASHLHQLPRETANYSTPPVTAAAAASHLEVTELFTAASYFRQYCPHTVYRGGLLLRVRYCTLCVCVSGTTMSRAKMAESVEMPFEVCRQTYVDQGTTY